jgi:23S rRNA (uracil1939-C5)-methyltransferase
LSRLRAPRFGEPRPGRAFGASDSARRATSDKSARQGRGAPRPEGQLVDVEIDALDVNGDGVATAGGLRITVPFTIPGELVRVRLVDRTRGRPSAALGASRSTARGTPETATLLEVLRPSPHRITPPCRHFGSNAAPGIGPCGGCTWQHIAYVEQLRLKTELVDRLVRAVVPHAPAVRPMLAATPIDRAWGYRNKVHFVFGSHGSTLTMGHYVRGSRRIIPVVECPVHDERGNVFAFRARDVFAAAGILPADGDRGTLRSLAIRVGSRTREIMATLIVSSDRDRRVRSATRRLLDEAAPTSMHLNVHAREDAFIFGPSTRRIHGSARMREEIAGASFLMSPAAFFQTNVPAAEVLVRLVLDACGPASRVLDLYAGSGLFAIPLAAAGHDVVAVEENRLAVADGEAALKLNSAAKGRCRFMARRVETALPLLRSADIVVLDPPREGCAPQVLHEVFGRLRPSRAVYVSCNPDALAGDLRPISRAGYQISTLQPVDMFPQTAHIETVVTLDRTGTG